MILIVTSNEDQSTNDVIKWLDYFGEKWLRLNEDDYLIVKEIKYSNNIPASILVNIRGHEIDLCTIKGYWYRRGGLRIKIDPRILESLEFNSVNKKIIRYLEEESKSLVHFINQYLEKEINRVNSELNSDNKKMFYLHTAMKVGLNVPPTIITTESNRLREFKNKYESLITKSIYEVMTFTNEGMIFYNQTHSIPDIENAVNPTFFPSLFQQNIEKFIELRIFYLRGKIFAMAIFSQSNEKTKQDFRNYDYELPNRNVPYKLDADLENKLRNFMNEINLDCGSIDMIVTKDNQYYFLEVNPIGQFGMVSYPCGYYLEKEIAAALINK
ncbi:grasp-with-spasm system ATP-grasp peptide maturase [Sphingobacterium faecium]|uniref:grasp-with-spasm system ATP-grasp peptide maturase n=1 Tax=Sphingobacterium faecium TaxID=34087 RepID=UPI0032093D03